MPVVPAGDGVVVQLEPVRVVVVQGRADDLVLGRQPPAHHEPGVGLVPGRTGGRHHEGAGSLASHHTAPSSLRRILPANDDIVTSRSPGKWTVEPVVASTAARDNRHTLGTSTRRYAPSSRTSTPSFSSSIAAAIILPSGVACSTGPTPTPGPGELTDRTDRCRPVSRPRRCGPGSAGGTRPQG